MDARATSKGYKATHNLRGLRVASRAHSCEGVAVSRARARCLLNESVAGAKTACSGSGARGLPRAVVRGVSRTPSSRGATPVPTEGTLKPARACGGRALYVVSRGARIASGARRCPAPSCGAGAVRQSLCAQRRLAASVLQAASVDEAVGSPTKASSGFVIYPDLLLGGPARRLFIFQRSSGSGVPRQRLAHDALARRTIRPHTSSKRRARAA